MTNNVDKSKDKVFIDVLLSNNEILESKTIMHNYKFDKLCNTANNQSICTVGNVSHKL